MKIAIIGAGIIGLTLALTIKRRNDSVHIELIEENSLPSNGPSLRNSGVLHAGLYYNEGSLKAQLCAKGRSQMVEYIKTKRLPILECGKILVPLNISDNDHLNTIKEKADKNGCTTKIIDFKKANQIQPGICRREQYLWSPKTSVMNPSSILKTMVKELQELGVILLQGKVTKIDSGQKIVVIDNAEKRKYDYIFNVSGSGALVLYQNDSGKSTDLKVVPILGQYATDEVSADIRTNVYPVPDPNLPFLGIHVTPRPNKKAIIGPNAVPIFSNRKGAKQIDEIFNNVSNMGILTAMYLNNKNNFRVHANKELTLSSKHKFKSEYEKLIPGHFQQRHDIQMNKQINGIRPQIINYKKLELYDDFICEKIGNTLHVVNAISPAFTSSFAMADYLIDKSQIEI